VVDKLGALQWTRDDFGLGTDRNLSGYKRYKMTGSDEEGTAELTSFKCIDILQTLFCHLFPTNTRNNNSFRYT
jgi:hypothetical protein